MHASASVVPHLMTHFDTKEGRSIAFAFSLDARIGGRQNLLLPDDAGGDWREGGDIAFNELVKECLFVHGWNERTGRIYDPNPKLSAMPHYVQVQPRMEWKTEEWE